MTDVVPEDFKLSSVLERLTDLSFAQLPSLLGAGVPIDEFVEIIFRLCSENDPNVLEDPLRTEILTISRILFITIDINSNGDVSWEEFSHHVLHSVSESNDLSDRKEIVQHIVYPRSADLALAGARLKQTSLLFIPRWERYCFLEVFERQKSVLSLFKTSTKLGQESLTLSAVCESADLFEDAVYVDAINSVVASTASEKLQFFVLTEDALQADSKKNQLQHFSVVREHYLQGRHPVLRYDAETCLLMAGGSDGTVSILDPTKDFAVSLPLVQHVLLHPKTPVLDLVVLPERGTKLLLSAGLDGKIQMYDIIRTEFFGELGSDIGAHNMSFNDEYSCLVTCSNKSLDPLVWSPHAVSNPFVHQLIDDQFHSSRGKLVSCYSPPSTSYCFSADSNGLMKLWDMRKMRVVRTFMADARETGGSSTDVDTKLWLRCMAAHPTKLDVVSCCRSDTGIGLYLAKAANVPERNPAVSHDDAVVSIDFSHSSINWAVTASKSCVKCWDLNTGEVVHHLKNFWGDAPSEVITCCAVDAGGKRFYLGTDRGLVTVHTLSTCGMIGECTDHESSVYCVRLSGSTVYSAAVDGSFHVSSVAGDAPVFLYAGKRDELCVPAQCFDVSTQLRMVVIGDCEGSIISYDCSEGGNGAMIGISREIVPELEQNREIEVTELHPNICDIVSVKIAGSQPFAMYGTVQGSMGIIALRPHPIGGTRLCLWKCYYPRSSKSVFAVALTMEYDPASQSFIVGDDQGNIAIWSCTEVAERFFLQPTRWPIAMQERMSMPVPTDAPYSCAPRLIHAFCVEVSAMPIRMLRILPEAVCVVVENCVSIWSLQGDHHGTLQQGQGTALSYMCTPYNYDSTAAEDLSASAMKSMESVGSLSMITNALNLDRRISRRKSSGMSFADLRLLSAVSSRNAENPQFVPMSDEHYKKFCSPKHSDSDLPEHKTTGDKRAAIDRSAVTPPPSPKLVVSTSSRVQLPFPSKDRSTDGVGESLPKFLQLKKKKIEVLPNTASSVEYGKIRSPSLVDEFEPVPIATQIVEHLDIDETEFDPHCFVPAPLSKADHPTVTEIFAGPLSSEQDWMLEQKLHPSPSDNINKNIQNFRPFTITTNAKGIEVGPLKPLKQHHHHGGEEDKQRDIDATSADSVSVDTQMNGSFRKKFVRFHRKVATPEGSEKAVARAASTDFGPLSCSLDDFVPLHEGSLISEQSMRHLQRKIRSALKDAEEREIRERLTKTSAQSPTPTVNLNYASTATLLPRPSRPPSGLAPPQPLVFTVGYGKPMSKAEAQTNSQLQRPSTSLGKKDGRPGSPSWQSASSALERRRSTSAQPRVVVETKNTDRQSLSRPSTSATSFESIASKPVKDPGVGSMSHRSRQEYIHLMLNLPRLMQSKNKNGQVDVVVRKQV